MFFSKILLTTPHIIFTDSLVYRVTTHDFYKDVRENPILLENMDTSNLPEDHPCFTNERKKMPGVFKDETGGRTMYEFIALRAKSYAYNIEENVKITAKGIRGHVVKNHLTFDDHKQCLFEVDEEDDEDDEEKRERARISSRAVVESIHHGVNATPSLHYNPFRVNVSIKSYQHNVKTVKTVKRALNRFDDKRIVCADRISTVAFGHYVLDK